MWKASTFIWLSGNLALRGGIARVRFFRRGKIRVELGAQKEKEQKMEQAREVYREFLPIPRTRDQIDSP